MGSRMGSGGKGFDHFGEGGLVSPAGRGHRPQGLLGGRHGGVVGSDGAPRSNGSGGITGPARNFERLVAGGQGGRVHNTGQLGRQWGRQRPDWTAP
eukprot:696800-Prorocentrum_minimum.AAC.1